MKHNKKRILAYIDRLQMFGFISCSLLIGTLISVKIMFELEFNNFIDILAFLGMIIMMSLLATPFTILIHWLITLGHDDLFGDNIYETSWSDGRRDNNKHNDLNK